jgi:crotonobetainyl-CoA:carnitine CoA-transferase CaiB-like acyl-CoA transferase
MRMSRLRMVEAAPAPGLGAHTVEVLMRVLGMTESEVEALVAQGVCR